MRMHRGEATTAASRRPKTLLKFLHLLPSSSATVIGLGDTGGDMPWPPPARKALVARSFSFFLGWDICFIGILWHERTLT